MPPAIPLTAGSSCADAFALGLDLRGDLVSGSTALELTQDNTSAGEGVCEIERDVFVAFEVPETLGADGLPRAGMVLTVHVATLAAARIALDEDACGGDAADACARGGASGGATWIGPLVAPGAHVLRIRVDDALESPLDVTISIAQERCPAGFLPTADAQCHGFVPVRGPSARVAHTVTALDDGYALVAGGRGEDRVPLQDAYIFDPSAAEFFYVSMTTPRAGHAAAILDEGSVALVGGTTDSIDAEIFYGQGRFFFRSDRVDGIPATEGVIAVGLGGPVVAVITTDADSPLALVRPSLFEGDWCDAPNNCGDGLECRGFDVTGGGACVCASAGCASGVDDLVWMFLGADHDRIGLLARGAGALVSGPLGLYNALFVGGTFNPDADNDRTPFDGALFSASTVTFTDLRPENNLRHRLEPRVVSRRGRAMIAGGRSLDATEAPIADVEVLSPYSNEPARTFALATPRADFVLTQLTDDEAIAIGGRGPNDALLRSTEILNAALLHTRPGPILPHALTDAAGATLADGSVLLIGGRGDDGEIVSGGLWLRHIPPSLDVAPVGQDIILTPAADTCADAEPLVGSAGVISGTTFGARDDYDPNDDDSCLHVAQYGPDVVHELAVPANATVSLLAYCNVTSDVAIYVVDTCPAIASECIAGSDSGFIGASEGVTIPAEPLDRTLWIIIDSYWPDAGLQYTLEWSVTGP